MENFESYLTEVIETKVKLSEYIDFQKMKFKTNLNLQDKPGIYVFWWIGKKDVLKDLNRKVLIKGAGGKKHAEEYSFDWFDETLIENKEYPLYVGKTTKLRQRISQHLMLETKPDNWFDNFKDQKEITSKDFQLNEGEYYLFPNRNSSCQFRAGMQLLLKDQHHEDFWKIIEENISISIIKSTNEKNTFVKRFYLEDYLIGALRPWFNLDSER